MLVVALQLTAGCVKTEGEAKVDKAVEAVTNGDLAQLETALSQGGNANSADKRGVPALMIAASSDQFRAANLLIAAGADIWIVDDFGATPAHMAQIARLEPGSPEADARDLFVAHLRDAGYPWPPPTPAQILDSKKAGHWPPRRSN
jgi:hypothetical protein